MNSLLSLLFSNTFWENYCNFSFIHDIPWKLKTFFANDKRKIQWRTEKRPFVLRYMLFMYVWIYSLDLLYYQPYSEIFIRTFSFLALWSSYVVTFRIRTNMFYYGICDISTKKNTQQKFCIDTRKLFSILTITISFLINLIMYNTMYY